MGFFFFVCPLSEVAALTFSNGALLKAAPPGGSVLLVKKSLLMSGSGLYSHHKD
jgi:hypothetical protein